VESVPEKYQFPLKIDASPVAPPAAINAVPVVPLGPGNAVRDSPSRASAMLKPFIAATPPTASPPPTSVFASVKLPLTTTL